MSGIGSAVGAVVGTIIAPGVGTSIGAALGGAADSVARKDKSSTQAPEAPKPVETYKTQQEAVRSQSEANRRRSSFSNTFVASRGMGTGGIGKSFLGQ
jgi:hypothetical protein